jgi:hypothetical protein
VKLSKRRRHDSKSLAVRMYGALLLECCVRTFDHFRCDFCLDVFPYARVGIHVMSPGDLLRFKRCKVNPELSFSETVDAKI